MRLREGKRYVISGEEIGELTVAVIHDQYEDWQHIYLVEYENGLRSEIHEGDIEEAAEIN